MFKKLFGKKKSQKPESYDEAKNLLIESISEESSNKNLGKNFDFCLEFLEEDETKVEDLASSVLPLIESLPLPQAALALSVCVGLIERGYHNDEFIDKIISIYDKHLSAAQPLFKLLEEKVKMSEEGDTMVQDIHSIYNSLVADRNLVPENVVFSAQRVEAFSQSIAAILSISPSYVFKYKSKLKDNILSAIDSYPVCYWLFVLLDILFEDPILVIDIDNNIGFEGKMSGVSDNFQLQHLLMGLSELNENPAISEADLAVANGTGIHVSNTIMERKWNMYTHDIIGESGWEEIKIGPAKTFELQDHWILGKDQPIDIPVREGRRVILLGRCSHKQPCKLQRTFKNLKANIEVERMLTDEEINTWLGIKE